MAIFVLVNLGTADHASRRTSVTGLAATFLDNGCHRFTADVISPFKPAGTETACRQPAGFTHDIYQYVRTIRRKSLTCNRVGHQRVGKFLGASSVGSLIGKSDLVDAAVIHYDGLDA